LESVAEQLLLGIDNSSLWSILRYPFELYPWNVVLRNFGTSYSHVVHIA